MIYHGRRSPRQRPPRVEGHAFGHTRPHGRYQSVVGLRGDMALRRPIRGRWRALAHWNLVRGICLRPSSTSLPTGPVGRTTATAPGPWDPLKGALGPGHSVGALSTVVPPWSDRGPPRVPGFLQSWSTVVRFAQTGPNRTRPRYRTTVKRTTVRTAQLRGSAIPGDEGI